MSDETVMPRVTAPPLPERVAANYYVFYALIDSSFFISLLHET